MSSLTRFTKLVVQAFSSNIGIDDDLFSGIKDLGLSIRSHFQMISAMKHHWSIAQFCYDWLQEGNEGQITIIVLYPETTSLLNSLLDGIGIRGDKRKVYRVEKQIPTINVKNKKQKKGTTRKDKKEKQPTFLMTQISNLR